MTWTSFFLVSIIQSLFLIFLIFKGSKNKLASSFIILLLAQISINNLVFIIIRTSLEQFIPQIFQISFGTILITGPLFYFYTRSVVDPNFTWKKKYWLNFIPYLILLGTNLRNLFVDRTIWIKFIDSFLSGEAIIYTESKISYAIQYVHFLIYLIISFRLVHIARRTDQKEHYLITVGRRAEWLSVFLYCYVGYFCAALFMYLFVLLQGRYNPLTNYLYGVFTSGIVYFLAYKMLITPELISPPFVKRYRSYTPFENEAGEKYLRKIGILMDQNKIFTDPDLKLSVLAKELGLPAHQLSILINDRLGRSFKDLINEYRIKEFLQRIKLPESRAYTIYSIAGEVGFNSKSSFNAAFKKATGKTPSSYIIPA